MEPLEPTGSAALTSVKQMRALAHPLRLQILGELRVNGPATAGRLSEHFDEAPGTLSYHLGKLAEFGFVEEVPELSADRRERWWRSVHEFTTVPDAPPGSSPAERTASSAVRHNIVDVYAATMHRVIETDEERPREWAEASIAGDTLAFLTVDQLAEASAELDALMDRWHRKGDRSTPGTRAVQIIVHAIPRP